VCVGGGVAGGDGAPRGGGGEGGRADHLGDTAQFNHLSRLSIALSAQSCSKHFRFRTGLIIFRSTGMIF
jgi:hypothetical protein